MKLSSAIKYIMNLQVLSFLTFNKLDRRFIIESKGRLFPQKKSCFILHKKSRIVLKDLLITNANCMRKNGRSTIIRLDEESRLYVNGRFSVFYGGDIIVFRGGQLVLNGGYVNSNIKIRCHERITIGEQAKISHDVTIMDSDAHQIDYEGYQMTAPVEIGNNVWIGSRVTILKGVKIGDGSIIAAGSVVTRSIPSNCLAAGVPARVIKENIKIGD